MDLISIIIPVYNRLDAFEKTLSSVLNQTYKNIEIIVVDDGSREEVKIPNFKFQIDSHVDIKLYRQENKGAPTARNKGFDMSQGSYVFFCDADVIAKEYMIENMFHTLEKNPDCDFVYSNFLFGKKCMRGRVFDSEALKQNNFITTMTLMRRCAFPRFDETITKFQDWDLFLTMVERGSRGVWIDETLFQVETGGTMSDWLPACAYKNPWKYVPLIHAEVKKYEEAKKIIIEKHGF